MTGKQFEKEIKLKLTADESNAVLEKNFYYVRRNFAVMMAKLRKSPHLAEQEKMLLRLKNRGYWAEFGVGWADSIMKIHQYLGEPISKKEEI